MQILIKENLPSYGEDELRRDLTLLPAWRREQALRYKHFEGQRNCVRAFLALWECVKDRTILDRPQDMPEFLYNEHGKPSLPKYVFDTPLHFSLSHCREAVAAYVDDEPCGVDIESVGRYSESVARHSMNDDEFREIQSANDPSRRFVGIWTRKEALLKALGTGIQDNMRDIFARHPEVKVMTVDHPDKHYIMSHCCL